MPEMNAHLPLLRQEFPDFDHEVSAALTSEMGFEDTSWHNDTCPSFTCDVFVLFVDYVDPTKREHPESPIYAMRCEDQEVLATDSWDDVRAFVVDGKRDFPGWIAPLWTVSAELEYENGQQAVVVWIAPKAFAATSNDAEGLYAVIQKGDRFEAAWRDAELQKEGSWINPEPEQKDFATIDECIAAIAIAGCPLRPEDRTPKVVLALLELELRAGYGDELVDLPTAQSVPSSVLALAKELAAKAEA